RGGGRHAAGALPVPHRAPGRDRRLLPPPGPGYSRGVSDQFIDLGDRTLRVRRLSPQKSDGLERTTLVFLHEGLGCIEMWRDFPQKLCDVLQCDGVVYDRTAYGQSSPWPSDPGVKYMEIEADVVLPKLLS